MPWFRPDLPIVVLTVVTDASIQRKIWEVGAADIISKPAEIARIAEALLKVTRKSR